MRVVVYGSRPDGHAKVIVELLQRLPAIDVVGLIDDYAENSGRRIRELAVIGRAADLVALRAEGVEGGVLGFGQSDGRLAALARMREAGLALPAVADESALIRSGAVLAEGCQVLGGAHVGPDAVIGIGALVNTRAVIAHDVRLDDGAVVGPGAVLAGRAAVRREAFLGAGAIVLPDVVVGAGVTVGAGAVVTRSVSSGTVVGVPARPLG
jgi:UDP-perosamine 4-acetyltransferase